MTQSFEPYAMLDGLEAPLPVRSRLYSLPPCGLGTADVESITSYTARLAQAQGLTVRQLIDGEIRPGFGPREGSQGGRHLAISICKDDARALCSVRTWAAQWVSTLQALTRRADLRCTTLLSWANVLSHVDLIRPERAWCPDCYQAWRDTHQPLYDPLLWVVQEVRICGQHRRPLVAQCPRPQCRRSQPHLTNRARPGVCAYCGAWLGARPNNQPKLSAQEMGWQRWVVEVVGELLANAPWLEAVPSADRLAYATALCVQQMADGHPTVLAHQLGRTDDVMETLQGGCRAPTLGTVLRLCHVAGVTPLQFLTQTPLALHPRRKPVPLRAVWLAKPRRLLKHDNEICCAALEQALHSPAPPSMREMGRRLQCDAHYLYRRFPQLCKAIARQYLAFRKSEKARRLARLEALIRQAVFELHRQGLFPSRHRVRRHLGWARFGSNDALLAAWRTAVEELGLAATGTPTSPADVAAYTV